MYFTIWITKDKDHPNFRRLICRTSTKIPERPYELMTTENIPLDSLNETWKNEARNRIKRKGNRPDMNLDDVIISTYESNYTAERFEYWYWEHLHVDELFYGHPNTLHNYIGPKIKLECSINVDQPFLCTPLVIATYHSHGCNFMDISGKSACTCGGQDTPLCSCIWEKFANNIDSRLLREQDILFSRLKKKIKGERLIRRYLKAFAQQHHQLLGEYRPKRINRDIWVDFVIPQQMRRFRSVYAHELALLGFTIHSTTQQLWLEENLEMYEGSDKVYLEKIKRNPDKMTVKDDEFRCFDDNTCISNANVCDFEYNCGDGSDETVCPSDFDFNDCQNLTGQIMCYWTEEQVDNLEWDIKTENETKNLPHGPKVDIDDNTRYYLNIKTRHF